MYIQVTIEKTFKGYHAKDEREVYDTTTKQFKDIKEVREWIREEYGTHRRNSMFVDDKDGKPKKIGWIIGLKSSQYNNDTGRYDKFTEQHWIGLERVDDYILR